MKKTKIIKECYLFKFSILIVILFTPWRLIGQVEAPKNGNEPVKVGVKFLVNEILDISTVEETFDIDGYLTLSWNDNSLRDLFPKGRYIIYDEEVVDSIFGKVIWHPNVEIMNSIGGRKMIKKRIEIKDDQIIYVERFQSKMQSNMDFTNFPFDNQICDLIIESFGFNADNFVFVPIHTDRNEIEEIENDAWDFSNMRSSTSLFIYENSISKKGKEQVEFSRFEFSIRAQRKAGYFIWQFFLPLMILIVATWFVPSLWSRGTAQELIFTILLASVMFSFYSASFLPQLSYNTFLETIVIVTNGVVFLTLLLVLTRKKRVGKPLFYHQIWFIPIVSVLSFLITGISFFMI